MRRSGSLLSPGRAKRSRWPLALWLGGASPIIVIQNTGLLESGDAIRGTAQRMGAPVPFIVTGRGYEKMERAGVTAGPPPYA